MNQLEFICHGPVVSSKFDRMPRTKSVSVTIRVALRSPLQDLTYTIILQEDASALDGESSVDNRSFNRLLARGLRDLAEQVELQSQFQFR